MALKSKPNGRVGDFIDRLDRRWLSNLDRSLRLKDRWIPKALDEAATQVLPWKGHFLAGNMLAGAAATVNPLLGPVVGVAAKVKRFRHVRPIFPNLRALGKR